MDNIDIPPIAYIFIGISTVMLTYVTYSDDITKTASQIKIPEQISEQVNSAVASTGDALTRAKEAISETLPELPAASLNNEPVPVAVPVAEPIKEEERLANMGGKKKNKNKKKMSKRNKKSKKDKKNKSTKKK